MVELQHQIIRSASTELFPEVIRTLPVVPIKSFAGLGIGPMNEQTFESHTALCKSKGAIPYSGLNVEFDNNKIDVDADDFFGGNKNSHKEMAAFLEGVLTGGRPYAVGINANKSGFQQTKGLIERLLAMGYQVYEADFVLHSHSEMVKTAGGSCPCTTEDLAVKLMKERYHMLDLESRQDFQISKEIQDWYNALAAKYKSK